MPKSRKTNTYRKKQTRKTNNKRQKINKDKK